MTQHLLSTKIQVPPLSPQTVRRTRLLEALDRGLQPNIRVTLISAPAGYGKTTLLSDWLQGRDLAAAWLSISEGDNDAARFVNYLLAAAGMADDARAHALGLDIPAVAEGQISAEEFKQRFLVPMINHIGRREKETVFVFDDYHLIQSQPVHDLTSYLIENLPPQAHVYIATRADPPLPITRFRGRGQVNELRLEDLRFQEDEAEAFFNALSGLHLAPEDVHTLQRQTEGWICGLQMAAAFLRGQEDTKVFIQGFSGSHHYIMDYLLDEVLRRESQELQTFLLETSILERLSGPLCDTVRARAVRELPLKNESPSDSRRILRELEQANLFIVPLDERREWYRYHRLFADLLQARLQDKDAGRIPELHRRASVWFAGHGATDDAVRHALLSADDEFAADTVERFAQEILLRSETATFLRWVRRLPEAQIETRPKLGIYRAWALLLQGAPLSAVQAQIKDSRRGHGPPGSARSLEAFILLSQGQIDQGLRRAQEALEMLPADEVFLHDFAAMCAAGCLISLGDVDGGMRLMEETAQSPGRSENQMATILILCELAELRQKQFQLDAAEELYRRSLAIGTSGDGTRLPIAGHAMMGLGGIAVERYDLASAERLLRDGIELAKRWSLINTLEGHLSLALLYDAREQVETQDIASLQDTVATLDDLASRFDASEFDDIIVEMLKMRVDLRKGHLDAVRRWIFGRGLDGAPDRKPAYYGDGSMASRIYKYELPILARWHIAEARYQEALDVLQELARLAEQAGRPHLLVESYILQARVFYRQGDGESALKVLKKALDIAGPQRSRRIFLVEGNDIIQLLKAGKREWDAAEIGDFVDSLLLASTGLVAGARDVIGGSDMLVEALSPRELEVLHLLPSGLTAVELADELLISVNTLRSHMKNIYAKLGVHSRHEAVVKATQLGLL